MSRVGSSAIAIPSGVTVSQHDGLAKPSCCETVTPDGMAIALLPTRDIS